MSTRTHASHPSGCEVGSPAALVRVPLMANDAEHLFPHCEPFVCLLLEKCLLLCPSLIWICLFVVES